MIDTPDDLQALVDRHARIFDDYRDAAESHLLAGTALQDAGAAEIHIVARSHGPAMNLTTAQLTEALTTLEGACDVNTCGDAQFAVFLPED